MYSVLNNCASINDTIYPKDVPVIVIWQLNITVSIIPNIAGNNAIIGASWDLYNSIKPNRTDMKETISMIIKIDFFINTNPIL